MGVIVNTVKDVPTDTVSGKLGWTQKLPPDLHGADVVKKLPSNSAFAVYTASKSCPLISECRNIYDRIANGFDSKAAFSGGVLALYYIASSGELLHGKEGLRSVGGFSNLSSNIVAVSAATQ